MGTERQEVQLGAPPWPKSWNFGVADDAAFCRFATTLRESGPYLATLIDPGVYIKEHRPLHVSWS